MSDHDARRSRLREKLVTDHLQVAEHVARRFAGRRGVAGKDLVPVATAGLITAVDRFDVHCGSDFTAFAVPTIVAEIRRHLRDTGWTVHLPRRLTEPHLRIWRAVGELAGRHGRAPVPSEIAAHLDISRDEVLEGLAAGYAETER